MRAYLLTAPRWILWLLHGLPFGGVMSVGILWDNSSGALEIILVALVAGLLYGVFVTFANEKRRRDVRALLGEVPRAQYDVVFRAVRRGPVPADPEIRTAARRVAAHDSSEALLGAIICTPFVLLMIAAAVSGGYRSHWPLAAAAAVLLVVAAAFQWYRWRSLKRRIRLLAPAAGSQSLHSS